MRSGRSEQLLLAALLAVPLAVAFLGWPAFVRWAVGPSPAPTPEVAGASATSAAVASAPAQHPTVGVPPTVSSRATTVPTVKAKATATSVAATSTSGGAPASESASPALNAPTMVVGAGDPRAAVQNFYARVAAHDFDRAALLWSPRMRTAFPPGQNISQRFSGTRAVTVQRADIISQSGDRATVAVDLDEATAVGQHHWSGTWQLVRGPDGWLLDQPQLEAS